MSLRLQWKCLPLYAEQWSIAEHMPSGKKKSVNQHTLHPNVTVRTYTLTSQETTLSKEGLVPMNTDQLLKTEQRLRKHLITDKCIATITSTA